MVENVKPLDLHAQDIHTWAAEKIAKQHLPLPARPRFEGEEFSLPDDPASLTNTELGSWMLRLASLRAYAVRLLGIAESELVLVEQEYRLRVNSAGLQIREELSGRPAADVVESAVLARDGGIGPLYKRRLELVAVKAQLEPRVKVYEIASVALSRELSRREMEVRLT